MSSPKVRKIILNDAGKREDIFKDYNEAREKIGDTVTSDTASSLMIKYLGQKP